MSIDVVIELDSPAYAQVSRTALSTSRAGNFTLIYDTDFIHDA